MGRTVLVTAFGETKSQRAWTLDTRCKVSHVTLINRLRDGWAAEKAIAEPSSQLQERHGKSKSSAYKSWQMMHQRCRNPNDNRYYCYGARGISVCSQWYSFAQFYADMGDPPAGKTLDRKESDGNYEPGNCRWATDLEQNNNKRTCVYITAFGETKTRRQWSQDPRCTVAEYTIRFRLRAGLTPEQAITNPKLHAGQRHRLPQMETHEPKL